MRSSFRAIIAMCCKQINILTPWNNSPIIIQCNMSARNAAALQTNQHMLKLLQTSILTVHMQGYTYPCIWTVTVNGDCPYVGYSMNMHGHAFWMSTTSSTELSKRTGLGQSLSTVTVLTQGYTYPSIWTAKSKNSLRQSLSTATVQNLICLVCSCFFGQCGLRHSPSTATVQNLI